jgi:hypothetical protein
MNMVVRALAVCVAALVLVAAPGCGSDKKASNDYVDAINTAQTDFAASIKQLGNAPSGTDPAQAAKKTFSDLNAAIDKVIKDIKAVKPPAKVQSLHNQLVTELQKFGRQVNVAGASLASGDAKKILAAQQKFARNASALGTQISSTISDINTKLHD